ncbi:transposase [Pseudoalteromonas sp. MMG013]|uniref:REP-associated tyrosine transposase n=1 Tax=Pseudoalteromonas sp. MMG013 TaxID=2822687 RepID=UPI001FFD105A|nr:transposase [Pseudoalteromonas sp. MMG013]
MARPLRLEFAGALYHVTSRGNERKPIYLEPADFDLFLAQLERVCERFNWYIHAYCLMTNHYHLLVETLEANISAGMRQLNGVYTQSFNRAHCRVGHLFQGRFKSILVDKDEYLLELNRYIVLNPIRANMVETLEQWPWSSWHCVMGLSDAPNWLDVDSLLRHFSTNRQLARSRFAEFVVNGTGINLWQNITNQVFLGSDAFVQRFLSNEEMLKADLSEVPKKQVRAKALTLRQYEQTSRNRNEAIQQAYSSGHYSQKELGEFFNLHYSRISRIIAKGKT